MENKDNRYGFIFSFGFCEKVDDIFSLGNKPIEAFSDYLSID